MYLYAFEPFMNQEHAKVHGCLDTAAYRCMSLFTSTKDQNRKRF